MRNRATPRFWLPYKDLPEGVQLLADQCYALLRENPQHPDLHLKKVGRFSTVLVGSHYRALAAEKDAELVWFWIGSHADYDTVLKRQ